MEFSRRELRDLGVAWLTLGVAFAVLTNRRLLLAALAGSTDGLVTELGPALVLSMATVGVGFLLHELAHKVVAVRFGQVAEFRADYSMLFVALVGSLLGFLFAAPGAVYHRGRITDRANGLIALAGPVTNLGLAVLFGLALAVTSGYAARVAVFGVAINVFLAGFNMLPFGPLDGRTVLRWHKGVFLLVAVPSIGLSVLGLFVLL